MAPYRRYASPTCRLWHRTWRRTLTDAHPIICSSNGSRYVSDGLGLPRMASDGLGLPNGWPLMASDGLGLPNGWPRIA